MKPASPQAALLASLFAIATPTGASAQSAQEVLDQRYTRALAAGYKALFLCSATAHAEANGTERDPQSVHEWELTGIYPRLDPIIRGLDYKIARRPGGSVAHVTVDWSADMPARLAVYFGPQTGCSIMPIGTPEGWSDASQDLADVPVDEEDQEEQQAQNPAPEVSPATQAVLQAALGSQYGEGRTTAVLVRKLGADGSIAAQSALYAPGFNENTPQRTWSVAKSIAATLVGAAVHSGEYSVDDPVGLRYWMASGAADPRGTITIDHALRMASGRYSDTPGNRTDPLYWGGTTVDERAANWPVIAKPGSTYRYANNDTLMAVKAISPYLNYYPPAEFFAKIGMEHTVAETDYRGDYVLSSQVWSTAGDLANLGQLYANDGVWEGERLLPEGWAAYVSDPSGPQPQGTQWGYGAGWWTFARPQGNAFEGIPDDAFAARGNRGQYIVVVPSRRLVIVRRGEDEVGKRFDLASFTRDVITSLR